MTSLRIKVKDQYRGQHRLREADEGKGTGCKSEIEDRLKTARQEVDASELKKVSTTDPESRFMMNKKGKIELAYNPQLTVDRNGFVLANDVCQDAFDTYQLEPQVLQTESNVGILPTHVQWSFDAGYYESENLKILSDKKIDGYVYWQEKAEDTPYDKKYFHYDAEKTSIFARRKAG
jgi:transposase